MPASADVGSDWTHCADEGETCSPSGTKELRFGADTRYVTKVITGDVTCSATGLSVTDPAIGTVKSCDIRDLQLDSGVTANGSGDHRTVTITFNVYAAQAGTIEDLRSKITVQKTGEATFSSLGTNDIVSNLASTVSSSTFSIHFQHALVGSENIIRIDTGAFVDSSAVPYNQILVMESILFGEGTESIPYEIATADQLFKIRDKMGIGDYYKLTEDIDLSGYSSGEGWMPIGDSSSYFEGSLDGNGYTIKNLTINMPSRSSVGLFGHTSAHAVITNMKLEDVAINANTYVGGLVGFNEGVISNSSVTGNLNGVSSVGGLVGNNSNYAPISNSYAAAHVEASTRGAGGLVGSNDGRISSSHAEGSLSGGSYIGGLVGWNYGNGVIRDSYASGSGRGNDTIGGLVGLSQGYIFSSYATGSVSDGWGMGGLVGSRITGIISSSYYDIPVDNGLGTYVSTEAMKLHSTYAGFDFSNGGGAWGIDPSYNNGSPYLKAAVPSAVIRVSVSPATSSVAAGATQQLTAVLLTAGGAAQTVTWASSDNPNVSVDANGLVTVAPNAASGDYTLTATSTADASKIGTATVKVMLSLSGVGINVLGGKITGTSATMEYSLDSTDGTDGTWLSASDTNTVVSFTAGNLYVREVALPTNYRLVASIASAAGAPSGIGVDVSANQITGTTALQEYSTDNGATWANATAPHTSHAFVGGEAVKVRVKATASELASAATTAIHVATAASAPSGVSANLSGGQAAVKLVGANLTMEYSRDGGTTWQAVTPMIAAGTATIDVSAYPNDNLQVRTAATTSALPSLVTSKLNVGAVTSVTVSPATATVVQGANRQLTANVIATGGAPLTVTWTSSNPKVTVDANGLVTVASDAVVGNYTVTASSTFDTSITGAATIAVSAAPTTPPGGGGGGNIVTPPDNGKVVSQNGQLSLPAGGSGEVHLGDGIKIDIPANATDKELRLTIEKVLNMQNLLTDNEVPASPIYEVLKNFSENFSKPVMLTLTFDSTRIKGNQRAAIFYYDEAKKKWVEVGGKADGNRISVEVNHFTKYAVLVVGERGSTGTEPTANMSDVTGHWAEASIKEAVDSGIVKGYPDGTFKPNRSVTRAEFAVLLMNAMNPQDEASSPTFTDTAKIGAWAQKAVAQAVQERIIHGYSDGAFRPNEEITRVEMAMMLANALGRPPEAIAATGFADDKDIPAWAKDAVAELKKLGIVQGKGDNQFAPQDHATRAEAVTVLLKMLTAKK
ncbi:S-layer homology domain-containing protein [Cohnella boryungensis]|uniref:S-layer homology domain-containing protein n=1 Tax=Cohnella boryungensis TaxID=768479 RepID=A0ABV8SDL9_9BACL